MQDLLLSLLSRLDIWVGRGAVDSTEIVNVNISITVFIHNVESFGDVRFTVLTEGSADCAKELVVVNQSVSIVVENAEERSDLTLAESKHIVLHGFGKFILIQ